MIDFLKENYETFIISNVLLSSESLNREIVRGFLLLPEKIHTDFFTKPNSSHLDKKLALHMSCLNITSMKYVFCI